MTIEKMNDIAAELDECRKLDLAEQEVFQFRSTMAERDEFLALQLEAMHAANDANYCQDENGARIYF